MGNHVGSTTARLVFVFWLVGGNLNNGAFAGVGCVNSNNTLSFAYWNIGGRSSGEKNVFSQVVFTSLGHGRLRHGQLTEIGYARPLGSGREERVSPQRWGTEGRNGGNVKTYCKGVNITSQEHLEYAYAEFSRGNRTRKEFRDFFRIDPNDLFDWVRGMVEGRRLELPPITYFERTEPTNGKTRTIGRASAKQQFLDYVCVTALHDLFEAKVGYHQCASVRGKGQKHARRYIQRWVRDPKSRYYVKLDINKYYPNVDRAVLFAMLERDVRNPDLVWLIEALIQTHRVGLNIGSYLSQYLANYYLSGAYAYAYGLSRTRKGRRGRADVRESLCDHVLTYMDDWLVMGHDKANLKSAVRKIIKYLKDVLHVTVKPWKVCRIDCEPVDMCGFVFRRDRTTIRAGIFRRARRAVLRANRKRGMTPHIAARIVSYWGYFKVTACRRFRDETKLGALVAECRRVISASARNGGFHEEDLQLGAA